MSAQPIEKHGSTSDEAGHDADLATVMGPGAETPLPERDTAPDQVEVRHQAVVSLVPGVATSAMAIAYLWRAAGSGAVFDWVLCGILALLTVGLFRNLLDARLPLLVADELGVRFRLGRQWRGLPWEAVDRIVVTPRRGLLRDGRLVVTLHHMHRAIEGIEGRARRHATLNEKMYGAVLAVPLGLTTRISHATEASLQDRFAELAQGRAEVVTLLPEPDPAPADRRSHQDGEGAEGPVDGLPADSSVVTEEENPELESDAENENENEPGPERERWSRWRRRFHDSADDSEQVEGVVEVGIAEETADARADEAVVPVESVTPVLPHQDVRSMPANVRSIARLAEPVPPPVIEDFEPHPAYDPVIGPELAAARTRVGLSVDELADRTRIRPHVIESIEVDDFIPCGGDFYARGHIRTLARVLGKDPAPMLAHFDQRYATAPISPRRVFEAELATGLTGSMRKTTGGPSWTLLIAVVLLLVLVWSAIRLFSVDSDTAFEAPPPILNGSAGLDNGFGEAPETAPPLVETQLTAVEAGAAVEVRDGDGTVVFEGDLVIGEVKTISAQGPVTVSVDSGSAVSVSVDGQDRGFLGETEEPATQVFPGQTQN
jgi:cytoskeletal protein RodZ